jgi:PAS domain S-box-containing protein
MTGKPSYEELEQRLKDLEKETAMREQAEDALRESEERYRTAIEGSNDGVAIVRGENHFYVNDKFAKIFGYDRPEEIVGRPVSFFVHPDDRERVASFNRSRQQGNPTPSRYECKGIRKDGSLIYLSVSASSTTYNGDPVSLVFLRDATERKLAEDHIHKLSHELIRAQENERQMISRELHDRIAQDLSTLKVGLDILFDNRAEIPAEITQRLSGFSRILQGAIMAVRDLSYDLRPPTLDQLGLVQTVFMYCEDFAEKTGINVDFASAGMDQPKFDSHAEINLYRLIQEGLNNVRKHADAGHVTIRLVASYPELILRIKDDGKGFDVNGWLETRTDEKRMGIRSMKERVNLLEGKMEIKSRPGEGTKILIHIPYEEKKSGSKEKDIDH